MSVKGIRTLVFFIALLAVLSICQGSQVLSAYTNFASLPGRWQIRGNGTPVENTADGGINIPVSLQDAAECFRQFPENGSGWPLEADTLRMSFRFAKDFPPATSIQFFSKDSDFLWREFSAVVMPDDQGTWSIDLPLRNRPASDFWIPCGHGRPWTPFTARNLLEFGFRFRHQQAEWKGSVELSKAEFLCKAETENSEAFSAYDFRLTPAVPALGRRVEMSFKLASWPLHPFDSTQFDVKAVITRPDGQIETVRAFYFEDFIYHPEEWDKTRCLTPDGEPDYRIRYYPRMPGKHDVAFCGTIDGHPFTMAPLAFDVSQGKIVPFVSRTPKDLHFLQYDNGEEFFGIGMNVRSPFDNRYAGIAPYSPWQDMGMAAYDYLMPKLAANGVNVMEVWMSSWWLALEWIGNAPGFHGVGHYNQYRAWMLDHILDLAEQNGIRLIIPLNNHGKFGMPFDSEWKYNPYNTLNGGFLDKCEDYFTDERARNCFKRTADYILSRWSASPSVLSWKLFTEVDLTGPTIEYYHHPSVAAWHAEMGDYLHGQDPWQHPVTTHWMLGYYRINDAIAALPQLDFLTTDIYYNLGQGTGGFLDMLQKGVRHAESWKKPLVITEYGGSSYGDSMQNLASQVEFGLWSGFFNLSAILPAYWWFALVEDKNLYPHYASVAAFAKGEKRQNLVSACSHLEGTDFQVQELRGTDRTLLWLFDERYFFTSEENPQERLHQSVQLDVTAPTAPGPYSVFYFDTSTNQTTLLAKAEANQKVRISLPSFRRTAALKILPALN